MLLFANNAQSTLRLPALATDLTLYVATGTGARFPQPGVGDSFFLTLIDSLGNVEIVECTARVNDTLTVVRARDSTTAKAFPSNTKVDHRVVAEAMRRLSPQSLIGQPGGLAPLDGSSRVPFANLPASLMIQADADLRYVRLANANLANGYLKLDSGGMVPANKIPSSIVTTLYADANYVKTSQLGVANGVATLNASGKIPASQFEATVVDLSGLAPKVDPNFSSNITVGGTASINNLTATGATTLAAVQATTIATTGAVTIKGGSPLGKRTLSTSPPSGTPSTGDEWIQHEA